MLGNFDFDKYLPYIIAISITSVIIYIITKVFYMVVFKKAKKSPIFTIIPFVDLIKLIEIAELPKSLFFLMLIPVANVIVLCRIKYEVAIRFGKGVGFTYVYVLFPMVGLYLLLPSSVTYTKLTEEEEKKLTDEVLIEIDPLKDFKPEIKPGAVPIDNGPQPYFEEKPIDLDVELKTITLEEEPKEEVKEEITEPVYKQAAPAVPFDEGTVSYEPEKKELVTVIPYEEKESEEEAPKVEVDLDSLEKEKVVTVTTGNKPTKKESDVYTDILGLSGMKNEAQTDHANEKVQYKKCPHCGVELESDLSICFMCGKNV